MKKILFTICGILLLASCSTKTFLLLDDGENLSSLTKITDNDRPCLSPFGGDYGENLFFSVYEKGGYLNIYSKSNVMAQVINKKTSGKNVNMSPCYSPVLKTVAFACKNDGMYNHDIYSLNATTESGLLQVTDTHEGNECNPCYSPDGRFIVYDKNSISYTALTNILCKWPSFTQALNSEMWMRDLKTGELKLLGKGYQPNFSPDGKKVAFVKYSTDLMSCNVWVMTLDTHEVTRITDTAKGYAFFPRWSPDGKKLVFQLTRNDKRDADLYTVNVDGSNMEQLTINKSYDGSPYWSKDGYLYFVSDRGNKAGNYQIWRIKMAGYASNVKPTSVNTDSSTNKLRRVNR